MVIIEPYRWIKSTAIKERLDLANKLNEIIEAIAPIDPDTINDINARLDALVLADTSISDRITTLDAKNVKTDTEQTITGKKIMINANNDIRVLDTPLDTHKAVNVTYVAKTDGSNNIVHTSANENIAGIKTFTTSNGLRATSQNNYNSILLQSKGLSNTIETRKIGANENEFDKHMNIGTTYSTPTSNNVHLRGYSPRVNFGDESEIQIYGEIAMVCNTDGTLQLVVAGIKNDGTYVSKVLASFDGNTWS